VDTEQDQAALTEYLAARFARFHPETARRLQARAETYIHQPLYMNPVAVSHPPTRGNVARCRMPP
jgi:hypothetical protein